MTQVTETRKGVTTEPVNLLAHVQSLGNDITQKSGDMGCQVNGLGGSHPGVS